ncbi:MAG: imidazole glycerol phosphate synthase subunit HisF [Rhodospirillales bacterium]
MRSVRLIARLDIKAPNLIKTVNLEGVRVVGDPQTYAERYYREGIDEILYLDAVASLYGRNHLSGLLESTAKNVFVPITVGGGVRSAENVRALLASGADKVAVNTAATKRPELLRELAEIFGSQCVVLQIDAKKRQDGGWEAYCDGGREHTGFDVREWAVRGQALGAGEILLTSIDHEGRREGFDIDLVRMVTGAVSIPVIAAGGMGKNGHLVDAVREGGADAAAMAHVLHYQTLDIAGMRAAARAAGVPMREARAA